MSKNKKVDLSTELADLVMGDENEDSFSPDPKATVVTSDPKHKPKATNRPSDKSKEQDADPTLALPKGLPDRPTSLSETQNKESSERIEIDGNKSVFGINIQRGIGARMEDVPKKNSKDHLTPVMMEEDSGVEEISHFFSTRSHISPVEPIEEQKKSEPVAPRAKRASSELILTAEASLVQSDHLRIAQERILELEKSVDSLRAENEELLAAGETLKNRSEDLHAQLERVEHTTKEKQEIYNEELIILRTSMMTKNEELNRAKIKIEQLETRLSGDLKKIRVRERELENRLELIKLESQAVIKNKDEIVLDLKRKIDQLNYELENYRTKGKELNRILDDNRERVRRTVKALRLALSMLEGDEHEATPLKKAD